MKNSQYQRYLSIVAGVMLLLAIPSIWPYGYYQLLRWVVSLTGVFNAYGAHKLNLKGWTITMIVIAIVFNPIAPLTFAKGTWILVDLATAVCVFFFVSAFKKETIEKSKL